LRGTKQSLKRTFKEINVFLIPKYFRLFFFTNNLGFDYPL
jgi:hypothetical protein